MGFKRNIFFLLITLLLPLVAIGQGSNSSKATVSKKDMPKVFMLGEFDKEFEAISMQYETLLLTACDNNMDEAFNKWMSMIQEMEAYADQLEFDIKGVKLWLYVFWEKNGSISHIAYHLKPNSRNINTDDFSAFFVNFINNYRFPLMSDKNYSHYASASFPTLARPLINK